MFPYQRASDIYKQIKNHTFTTCNALAKQNNISERSVRSDVKLINKLLEKNGARIDHERGKGYYLYVWNEADYEVFLKDSEKQREDDLSSSDLRIKFILQHLFFQNDWTSYEELCNLVFVGKGTIKKYLRQIIEVISQYNLTLTTSNSNGIKLLGNEEAKRECIMNEILSSNNKTYTIDFSKQEYKLFDEVDIDKMQSIVNAFIEKWRLDTSDVNRRNLIIHIALMVLRIRKGYELEAFQPFYLDESIISLLNALVSQIQEAFDCEINEAEKYYMFSHLVANTKMNLNSVDPEKISTLVTKTLDLVYSNYHFDLRNDDVLIKDLFHHFSSILSSKQFEVNKKNPLLYTLKTNFALAFDITLTTVTEAFQSQQINLTEDEIGYISLHIGAAIERCFTGKVQRKKVYIICGSGQATCRMLETRLHTYFRDKLKIKKIYTLNDFNQLENDDFEKIDFIISTVPIEKSCVPVILVDFSLTKSDVEAISYQINLLSNKKIDKIERFFSPKLFLHMESCKDKYFLLREMTNLLELHGCVNDDFIDSVLQRETLSNTAMCDGFALPHAVGLRSLKTRVSVAILDQPIFWNNDDQVNIVFLLALSKEDYLDFEYLYDLILEVINDVTMQENLANSKKYEDFVEIIKSCFSKEDLF